MIKNRLIYQFLPFIVLTIVFSACSILTGPSDSPAVDEIVLDLANPSAVYCEGLGYSLESVERNGGMDADCIFSDGTRCAAWDLLSGRCGQEFTYCGLQGYSIEEAANIGNCRFSDGSDCDEYLYFSGVCEPGDNPVEVPEEVTATEEVLIQIQDFISARDYLVAYLFEQYGIESMDPWMEANITPANAEGVTTFRYVSGPLWIEISAEASAPYASLYIIQEVSFIANGFRWEGTLAVDGTIVETNVVPPWPILNTDQARDAVLDFLVEAHNLAPFGSWIEEGISQTGNDTVERSYSDESWSVKVEFAPAAPLVSSYTVVVENTSEGIRWEGDITGQGDISETSFSD